MKEYYFEDFMANPLHSILTLIIFVFSYWLSLNLFEVWYIWIPTGCVIGYSILAIYYGLVKYNKITSK